MSFPKKMNKRSLARRETSVFLYGAGVNSLDLRGEYGNILAFSHGDEILFHSKGLFDDPVV